MRSNYGVGKRELTMGTLQGYYVRRRMLADFRLIQCRLVKAIGLGILLGSFRKSYKLQSAGLKSGCVDVVIYEMNIRCVLVLFSTAFSLPASGLAT